MVQLYPALLVLATSAEVHPASYDRHALASVAHERFWGSAVVEVTEHLQKSDLSSYLAVLPCGGGLASEATGMLARSLCKDAKETGNATALFLFGQRVESVGFSTAAEG